MTSAKIHKFKEIFFISLLLLISTTLYFYKLDYSYFFTDEILYVDSGRQYLKGNFENNMQVPFIAKYILGAIYNLADHNVFLIRTPFAIMGIFSAFAVFFTIKREFGVKLALIGFLMFLFNPLILEATKMGMLEAPMHLFWLLFAYFFIEANKKLSYLFFGISGLFLGLALASKFTSILLIPVVGLYFILHFRENKIYLKHYLLMISISGIGFLTTYIPALQKLGVKTTYLRVSSAFIDGYIGRSEEGKQHLIGGQLFLKSPWWSYIYFLVNKLSILGLILYLGGIISSLFNVKNKFLFFWGSFFISALILFQISGVKSERYLASLLIPSIFLAVIGIDFLLKNFKYIKYPLYILIFTQIVITLLNLVNLEPNRYNGLINSYISKETGEFSQNKKFYIYGSIRSIRWYVNKKAEGMDMFDYEKNLENICMKVNTYDYLVIDKEEIQRYGDNKITQFLKNNINYFETEEKYNFIIYKRLTPKDLILSCDK